MKNLNLIHKFLYLNKRTATSEEGENFPTRLYDRTYIEDNKVLNYNTLSVKIRNILTIILISLFTITSCKTKKVVETSTPIQENRSEISSPIQENRKEISTPIQTSRYEPEHSPDRFLVTYDEKVGKDPLLKAIEKYNCEIIYDYKIISGMALKKPEDKTLEETMNYFRQVKGVKSVEYDNIIRLTDPVKPKLETE
ncbi:MAG: hypothetical protein J6W61_05250 [Bacteroidales bacterium]|nr:hypothetical protein [Bacteroidales bacterium]